MGDGKPDAKKPTKPAEVKEPACKPARKPAETADKPLAPSPATALAKPEPASLPGADRADKLRQVALSRMGELFGAARVSGFYGQIAVEVLFVAGQAKVVRHRIDGTDKP